MLLQLTNKTSPTKVRHEKWHGRDYLVAPLVLVIEGTLNGNEGAIFYPGKEIRNSTKSWNGIPIVVYPNTYHPKDSSGYITARSPDTLIQSEVGRVFNAQASEVDGITRLSAEGWFDSELTQKIDIRVYNALINQQVMELSIGLDGIANAAEDGSKDHKGREYYYSVSHFKPDHVAILPTGSGACSIADGCGIFANSESNNYQWIVNPKGQWTPPESGDAPAEVKRILKAVYSSYRDKHPAENAETKAAGAKIAWSAVKKAGWRKSKAGKWVKRKKKKAVANASTEPFSGGNTTPTILTETVNSAPVWKKLASLFKKVLSPLVNQPSHSDIRYQLAEQLQDRFEPRKSSFADAAYGAVSSEVWIEEVYDKYVIFHQGEDCYKLGYTTDLRTNKVELSGDKPTEVSKVTTYKPVTNSSVITPTSSSETPSPVISPPNPRPGVVNSSTDQPADKSTEITNTSITNPDSSILPPEKSPGGAQLTENSMPLTAEQRTQFITNLKGDCKCHATMPWKALTDDQFKTLSDDTLSAYEGTRKVLETTVTNNTPVVTPAPTPVVVDTPTPVVTPVAQPIMNRLTTEEQEAIAFANEERMRRKNELVSRLTDSITDTAQKQAATTIYANMKPADLILLVNALPVQVQQQPSLASNWWPAAGPSIVNAVSEEPLADPVYDFSKS